MTGQGDKGRRDREIERQGDREIERQRELEDRRERECVFVYVSSVFAWDVLTRVSDLTFAV